MHPAKLGIDPVQIIVQALAAPANHLQAPGLPVGCDPERLAGLDHRQHAHQPFRHPVPFGNRLRPGLFRRARTMRAGMRQILDRPPGRLCERYDMIPDPPRFGFEKRTGVFKQNPPP